MKLYDNNPQSKAMQSLIHDTRNAGDAIRYQITKLRNRLKELSTNDSETLVRLEHINTKAIETEKAIDLYYERFSKDFPEELNERYKPEIPNAYNLTKELLGKEEWNNEMLPTYYLLKKLIEEYTLIRNPKEQALNGQ